MRHKLFCFAIIKLIVLLKPFLGMLMYLYRVVLRNDKNKLIRNGVNRSYFLLVF